MVQREEASYDGCNERPPSFAFTGRGVLKIRILYERLSGIPSYAPLRGAMVYSALRPRCLWLIEVVAYFVA